MKKMQCDVCGSTDIKKISNDIFECQSCGVQYNKDVINNLLVEVTGPIKIDYKPDIENALRRAEQFEENGDIDKAIEYYNKVLDLDPNNSEAKGKIINIKKQKEASDFFYIKNEINPDTAFNNFLKKLKKLKSIAPDIYKEIVIITRTEKYIPIQFPHGKYSGNYSGTACYRKEVPYTVYETKTDYNNKNQDGSYKKVQVPVTKYRTEWEKVPASGLFEADCAGLYIISNWFNDMFTNITPSEFDENLNTEKNTLEFQKCKLLKGIEEVLLKNISKYKKFTAKEELPNNIPIDDSPLINDWTKRAMQQYATKIASTCNWEAEMGINGDRAENVNCHWKSESEDLSFVYIPVQVIEYAYKGDFFIAVNILAENEDTLNLVYPYYNKIDRINEEGNAEVLSINNGEYGEAISTLRSIIFFVGAVISYLISLCASLIGEQWSMFWRILSISLAALGIISSIFTFIKKKKTKQIKEECANLVNNLSKENHCELEQEYSAFFKYYTDINSIDKCNENIDKISTYTCPNEDISYSLSLNA